MGNAREGRIIGWYGKARLDRDTADYAHKLATALTIGWRSGTELSGGDMRRNPASETH